MHRLLLLGLLAACTGPTDSKPDPDTSDDSTPPNTVDPRVDADADGFTEAEGDCDDTNAALNPGRTDACNGLDDNCDGVADEGASDTDVDGIADCLDTEDCDGVDNDGDGGIDEGFSDLDLDNTPDCIDVEECDLRDNDGDGQVDEGFDADADGYSTCGAAPDCDDTNPALRPDTEEVEDGVDNNCDGAIDEILWSAGELLITELMVNPDAINDDAGEWIEIINYSDRDLILNGLRIDVGDAVGTLVADAPVELRRYQTMVVGDSADPLENGGVEVEMVWDDLDLPNEGGSVTLRMGDIAVDYVVWERSDASSFVGHSRQVDPAFYDATLNDGSYGWCASTEPWPGSEGDDGTPGSPNDACANIDHDGDGFTAPRDCDDDDPNVGPGAVDVWYDGIDSDCGGGSDFDQDGDGFDAAVGGGDDCDDTNSTVNPRGREVCDTADVDEDCDGVADDDDASASGIQTWYIDADSDAYGDATTTLRVCDAPSGYSLTSGDCDDADATISPAATEVWYDGIDQDCDGLSDNDADQDGYDDVAAGGDDCDDTAAGTNPGAVELCDAEGADEDCNGLANEEDTSATLELWYTDSDGDGYGGGASVSACTPPPGYGAGNEDCDDADAAVYPGATDTWYDGVDSDCDGANDYDQDVDGYEDASGAGDDCDDADPDVHPYAWEDTADGLDNDCDGAADGADLDVVNLTALNDDDYVTVSLAAVSLPFCGTDYTSFYLSSNGLVTFDAANTDYSPDSAEMVRWIGVAGLWDDLYPPGGGEVAWIEYADAVGVYWRDVPQCCSATPTDSTFSVVIRDDGHITIDVGVVDTQDAGHGWSCGAGGRAPSETDLSAALADKPGAAVGVDQGTEDMVYEIFTGPRTDNIDLSGLSVPFCGQNGADADGDGWTDTCGDSDDNDASVYPE